jgi:hypothetical protein
MVLYDKKTKQNINCNYRRISFHNKEAVCSHINKPINTAYLRKCLHCYIEANKLRSNYSSELLYIVIQEVTSTHHGQY